MPETVYITRPQAAIGRGWALVMGLSVAALILAVPRYQPLVDSDEAILSDADGGLDATHVPKELLAAPPVVEHLVELSTAWVASCDVAHHHIPRPAILSRATAPRAPPCLLA